jgi:hypothetical protein
MIQTQAEGNPVVVNRAEVILVEVIQEVDHGAADPGDVAAEVTLAGAAGTAVAGRAMAVRAQSSMTLSSSAPMN